MMEEAELFPSRYSKFLGPGDRLKDGFFSFGLLRQEITQV